MERKNIASFAIVVGLGTFCSRIFGLIRDVLLASFFSRFTTDAWLVAFRIPNMFRRLFGEGSLSASFIPVFVGLTESGNIKDAKKLASVVFSLLLTILTAFAILGVIFAPEIIGFLTHGKNYSEIPGKVELTIELTRIMLSFVVLVCMYAFFMAIQNSFRKFLIPAFAPTLLNLSIIASVFLPTNWFDVEGKNLAWGVLVGGLLQLIIVIPGVYKLGFLPKLNFDLGFKHCRSVVRKFVPSVIGVGILQLTVLINTRFASHLPEGANSWLFWADRLLEFPLSLFAVSMGTALLPVLSIHYAQKNMDKFSKTLQEGLRQVLFLAIPSGVGLLMLSDLLITTIFMRGAFVESDVHYTSSILQVYGVSIIFYASIRVLQPVFYAIHNTWLPAIVSAICLGIHIMMAGHFIKLAGVQGLVISAAISAFINVTTLVIAYRILIGKFHLTLFFLKSVTSATFMGILLFFIKNNFTTDNFLERLLLLTFCITMGAVIYFIISWLIKIEEVNYYKNKLKEKLFH